MKSISKNYVEEIINQFYKLDVKLQQNLEYYQYQSNDWNIITIFNSELYLHNQSLDYFSIGKPILRFKKNNLLFYPPILDVLSKEIKQIEMNPEKIKKLSFGKDIEIYENDGLVIIKDSYFRKIAFGSVVRGKFNPLIDVGWYLREGK